MDTIIVNILATFFLPTSFLLVAHFLNKSNRPVVSRKITQYQIEIPGVGHEINL